MHTSKYKMKLIFNADDFGMRKITTDSIIHMHKLGIVQSTTLLTNFPDEDFQYAVEQAMKYPELGIGIHLNIGEGSPLIGKRFPHCHNGYFFTPDEYYHGLKNGLKLNLDLIREEFTAQIEKALDAGIKLTHIDSHFHLHYKTPCETVVYELSKQFSLPLRMPKEKKSPCPSPDDFISMSKVTSFEELMGRIDDCLENHDKIVEIGCHPTDVTEELKKKGGWLEIPERDWRILHDQRLLPELEKRQIQLVNFRDL